VIEPHTDRHSSGGVAARSGSDAGPYGPRMQPLNACIRPRRFAERHSESPSETRWSWACKGCPTDPVDQGEPCHNLYQADWSRGMQNREGRRADGQSLASGGLTFPSDSGRTPSPYGGLCDGYTNRVGQRSSYSPGSRSCRFASECGLADGDI
jgi:hypothetical protein